MRRFHVRIGRQRIAREMLGLAQRLEVPRAQRMKRLAVMKLLPRSGRGVHVCVGSDAPVL